MPDYALLVDGERIAHVKTESDVREWIAKYREDHSEDDPGAAHVQVLERGTLAWLTGGKLVPRERFFRDE
jgi:hypothetical protein